MTSFREKIQLQAVLNDSTTDPEQQEYEEVPAADVVQVGSIRELEDAIEKGAAHIVITEHLGFATSKDQSVLDLLSDTHSVRVCS